MKAWVVSLGLLLAACGSSPLVDTGRVAIKDAYMLPPPTKADLMLGLRPQIFGPFDKISVEVFGIPELTREEIQIAADGQLSLPLAGVIDASGKDSTELARIIEERLRAGGVRDPRVTINLREAVSQVVTVEGEVEKPGNYPLMGRSTMMRAIARAEGLSDLADANHVAIFRTVDNKPMAALYDLRAIRLGAYEDPEIYPNDVIVVGDSETRRLIPTIVQTTGVLLTPLVYLLRN